MKTVFQTYLSLLCCVLKPPSIDRVGDVEGMIAAEISSIRPSLHDEGVGPVPPHHQLWDQRSVDVPGNAPPNLTCGGK